MAYRLNQEWQYFKFLGKKMQNNLLFLVANYFLHKKQHTQTLAEILINSTSKLENNPTIIRKGTMSKVKMTNTNRSNLLNSSDRSVFTHRTGRHLRVWHYQMLMRAWAIKFTDYVTSGSLNCFPLQMAAWHYLIQLQMSKSYHSAIPLPEF